MADDFPKTYNGDLANPRPALTPLFLCSRWVVWRWEAKNGKFTKPPCIATDPRRHAANDRPETWSYPKDAVAAVLAGCAHGIGFALTDSDYAAIDLDTCRDPESGKIDAWAQDIIARASGAYVEVTVSGTGLRVIGTAVGAAAHRKFAVSGEAAVEVYRKATRYITVSCAQIGECAELTNIDELIDFLVDTYGQPKLTADAAPLFDGDVDDLIENGAPEGHRSEAFAQAVWSLAGQAYTQQEIEQELRAHPGGIARKYLKPRDRLAAEINRCYEKWKQAQSGARAQTGARNNSRQQTHDWDEPDYSVLEDKRGDLPDFPLDIFSEDWQAWARNAAHGAGTTVDHVLVPLLGVASSLVGTARRAKASKSWSEPFTLTIESRFVNAAVKLVRDYFWPHARAALRQIGLTERHAKTRRVLRWLQANGRDQVSREDVRREALARHLDAEETQKVIDALERAGWLKKVTTETAGRAKHRWLVNPKLFSRAGREGREDREEIAA